MRKKSQVAKPRQARVIYQSDKHHVHFPPELVVDNGWFCAIHSRHRKWQADPYFESCRELFQDDFEVVSRMLYSHGPGLGRNVAAFIGKIERMLRLPKRSVFGWTKRRNISWIEVSPFWARRSMKRSLFTALLRAGEEYDPERDNFDEAINSQVYLHGTRAAVDRFLAGYTTYRGNVTGWYEQFCLQEWRIDLSRALQKPADRRKKPAKR